MTVFADYAHYYDLLYRDKDYAKEAAYIAALLDRHAPQATSILDLGCGTGNHASLLASKGFRVHGVDLSPDMIRIANERKVGLDKQVAERLSFEVGDVRNYRGSGSFDAVLALFHVMNYQIDDQELHAAFGTARQHLSPGGIFAFDCWYGPAVLTDFPTMRIKRVEGEDVSLIRISTPTMYPNENRVDVHFRILVQDKIKGQAHELVEQHRMRYLFAPEISAQLAAVGFDLAGCEEWLTGGPLGFKSWNAIFIAKA